MEASEQEEDILTKISGIGPARQKWLAKTFDVRTYSDLAALSADEIEAKLSADGKPYARDEIEGWIQEAAELAAKKEELGTGPSVESSVPGVANSPVNSIESTAASNNGDEQWQQIAVFHVTYLERGVKGKVAEQRTEIEYHETGKRHKWDSIETDKIGQWIVEQAGDNLRPAAVVEEIHEEVRPGPEVAARLSVTVTRVRLNQPADTEVPLRLGKTGRPQFGVVRANLPFVVKTDIELSEEEAANGKREIPYQAQFYARNRKTGETIHLGDSKPGLLVSGKVASASLTKIALPPGRYRLQALVETKREDMAPGFYEVPVLDAV